MTSLIDPTESTANTQTPPSASEVVRHLAHELRQPLSMGRGPEIDEHVDRLQQLVEHANWVLADIVHLLDMVPPQPSVCDCNAVLEEVLEEAWAGEGLEIFYEPDPGLPRMLVDAEQMRHLFRSMLQFLSRFAAEPRQVYLATESAGAAIVALAKAKMESVNVETLFEPLSPQQLFTCRLIAERNGGRFQASRDEAGDLCLCCEVPAAAV
jgi:nitrogen-specific signal transduction histidine kinase